MYVRFVIVHPVSPHSFQIGIACRLNHPSSAMQELYGLEVISAVLMATYFFIGSLGSCLVPCVVIYVIREFCTITVVELQ